MECHPRLLSPNLDRSLRPLLPKGRKPVRRAEESTELGGTHMLMTLLTEEQGQDLVEYALIAGAIGLAAVASMKQLTDHLGNAFSSVGSTLTSAT